MRKDRGTELIRRIRVGNSPMKRALVTAATCCCALSNLAHAESCDQRYPGSCRIEVSTTIVRTKGDINAIAARPSRSMTQARKPFATGGRPAGMASESLSRQSPARMSALSEPASVPLPAAAPHRKAMFSKPIAIVDEAFNILTLNESFDTPLEAALINRRTDILGFRKSTTAH